MLDGRWLYVAAIPIAVAIVGRRSGMARTATALVAVAHIAVLANVALFPIPVDQGFFGDARVASSAGRGGLQLVPFATIGPVLAGHASALATRIAILNLFVLTPAGIYLPTLFRSLGSWPGLALLVVAGGTSIEAVQLAVSLALGAAYRAVDVDDVILNGAGIAVGWLAVRAAARLHSRWYRPPMDRAAADRAGRASSVTSR